MCSRCNQLTHVERLTVIGDGSKYCFECMCKCFDVHKFGMAYMYRENPDSKAFRVVKGRPLCKRKKVYRHYKDPAKRGLYDIEIKPSERHLYERDIIKVKK